MHELLNSKHFEKKISVFFDFFRKKPFSIDTYCEKMTDMRKRCNFVVP